MQRIFEIERDELKKYLNMHLTYKQIAEKYGCSPTTVMSRALEYGLRSKARQYQMKTDNPMAREEIRNKVSNTISRMWEDGKYNNRIDGMLGLVGEKNPNYLPQGRSSRYRDKAMFYHPEATCLCCGKQLAWNDESIEVHHVDENHDNFLLTNLMPLCHSCHRKYHRKSQFTCTLTKSFVFDACHYLPYHERKCKFLHGHTYHMDISIKNKVLQETGMVMDFGEIKKIVEEEVLDKFDHGFLNEYIEYPTCEVMISWIWFALSKRLKGIDSIKVWETDGSSCEMRASDMVYYLQNFECDWTKDTNTEINEEALNQ